MPFDMTNDNGGRGECRKCDGTALLESIIPVLDGCGLYDTHLRVIETCPACTGYQTLMMAAWYDLGLLCTNRGRGVVFIAQLPSTDSSQWKGLRL